ncbi:unnamed protein product [Moneuplotes crassus]|uniref:Uncharacterized protein n=1 Tax=Euplotes crassus TaxID=5936 RepID=A0AAD1XTD0_EUPCR|nr:unnamed protein product [Moneuplotes crassus]
MESSVRSQQKRAIRSVELVILEKEKQLLLTYKHQTFFLNRKSAFVNLVNIEIKNDIILDYFKDQKRLNYLNMTKLRSCSEVECHRFKVFLPPKRRYKKYINCLCSLKGTSVFCLDFRSGKSKNSSDYVNFRLFAQPTYSLIPCITGYIHLEKFRISQKKLIRIFCFIENLEIFCLGFCLLEQITSKFALNKKQKIDILSLQHNFGYDNQELNIYGPEIRSIYNLISTTSLSTSINKIKMLQNIQIPRSQAHLYTPSDPSLLHQEYNLSHIEFDYPSDS